MSSRLGIGVLLGVCGVIFSCGERDFTLVEDTFDAGASFGPTADAEAEASTVGLCPTNECPAGRTTCSSSPYPCGVDLSSDDMNCGECGNACPTGSYLSASGDYDLRINSHCVNGACQYECRRDYPPFGKPLIYADCNRLIEDGCEVDIASDDKNCGGCGIVCPDLHVCSNGSCVCAISMSCGACGNICPPSEEPPFPAAWHADRGCAQQTGTCNVPVCQQFWDDCNDDFPPLAADDLSGDGCETNVEKDLRNCGACGVTCQLGETCERGQCICRCGAACFDHERLNHDLANCGACGQACPSPVHATLEAHGAPTCNEGICDFRCDPGWADCDGDAATGCETFIKSDPLHCGACGARCEGTDGQACVDGQCTMTSCEIVR